MCSPAVSRIVNYAQLNDGYQLKIAIERHFPMLEHATHKDDPIDMMTTSQAA